MTQSAERSIKIAERYVQRKLNLEKVQSDSKSPAALIAQFAETLQSASLAVEQDRLAQRLLPQAFEATHRRIAREEFLKSQTLLGRVATIIEDSLYDFADEAEQAFPDDEMTDQQMLDWFAIAWKSGDSKLIPVSLHVILGRAILHLVDQRLPPTPEDYVVPDLNA